MQVIYNAANLLLVVVLLSYHYQFFFVCKSYSPKKLTPNVDARTKEKVNKPNKIVAADQ
jgi:hypothetical protein